MAIDLDLEALSLSELKELQRKVEHAIAQHKEREKRRALADVHALLRDRGLEPEDLEELISRRAGRRGRKVRAEKSANVPRFRNPANPSQTWTGRGRRPSWFIEHLQAGGSIDDLRFA